MAGIKLYFRPIAHIPRNVDCRDVRMAAALSETLGMVAESAAKASDDWWIIGSAAVALHGAELDNVKDVDLMMSPRDAEAFLSQVGGERRPAAASQHFRSQVFGVWSKPPIPVEVFGGFCVAYRHGWRPISLFTREPVIIAGAPVYVPSADELVRLLHSFGRAKDWDRAKLLRA